MPNGTLWSLIGFEALFAGGGGLLLTVALIKQASRQATQTLSNVATDLLLGACPLKAGIVNSVFIFITFVFSIPGIISPHNRTMLKVHGYMVMVCGIFTLTLGLIVWFETLKTRTNLSAVWASQSPDIQSLLQQKFNCCGYTNFTSPPFVQDSTCTNPLVAANLGGCVSPFGSFANQFLDIVFTADFGIVAIDGCLLLAIACVLKERKEQQRYRLIDEKHGMNAAI